MAGGISAVIGAISATGSDNKFFETTSAASNDKDGRFNLSVWGTFVGTFRVERSFDNGVTWLPATNGGTAVTFTAPMTEVLIDPENGVRYRLWCTAYTSGTMNYRFSQ